MSSEPRVSRRNLLKGTAGTLAGLTAANLLVDVGWLQLERRNVRLPNWHGGKVRIAFLTDPHLNYEGALNLALSSVEAVRREKPDFVVLGGDYLDYTNPVQKRRLDAFLERVQTLDLPTVAVLGNHDYHSRDVETIAHHFQLTKIRLLRNEAIDFDGFQVFGVDDGIYGADRPHLLREPRYGHSTIAVFHEPDYVDRLPTQVSLQLSGHSHGGQICLPFGVKAFSPRGAKRYVAGWYENAKVPLYVSRGLGTTGVPLRMYCRPEATILDVDAA